VKKSTTFISYSRRQLYFAESLALHLQKEGIDVWFDLQKLQAGTVWSEGLKEGVGEASLMVLVVSQASLESPYTQAEWKRFAGKGNRLVLAIYEPVDLPQELHDLPAYDFRSGFNSKLRDLAAFLKGNAEPRHDRVPSANRFGISATLPGAVWCTLAAQFGTLIACLLGLVLAVILNSAELLEQAIPPFRWETKFFLVMVGLSLIFGITYAVPLQRHKLEYKKVKRGVLVTIMLLVPAFLATSYIQEGHIQNKGTPYSLYAVFLTALVFTLFVYVILLRHSSSLLRWMQPEEALQNLRRRAHQPLVAKATFDLDAAAKREGKAVTYAIHTDRADEPVARWVEGIFKKAGHTRAAPDGSPQHHIAILSNRSSEAWVQEVTRAYAGKLVFVVVSTIEFKESLTETSRYQWVDARDGDQRDIIGLARSLGNVEAWKREAALETTPAMIDRWKVPSGITLLKRVMELFGIYVLVFGLTDLVGFVMRLFGIPDKCDVSDVSVVRSIFLVVVGAACFRIAGRALVYRKVTAPVVYGFLWGSIFLVSWLPEVLKKKEFETVLPDFLKEWGTILPDFLNKPWWLAPAAVLPLLLYSVLSSHFWLPAVAKANPDEVGIKKSIDRTFKRRNVFIVSAWVIVIVGIAIGIYVGWMK